MGLDDTVSYRADVKFAPREFPRVHGDVQRREQIVARKRVDRSTAGKSSGDNGVGINEVRNDRVKSPDSVTPLGSGREN